MQFQDSILTDEWPKHIPVHSLWWLTSPSESTTNVDLVIAAHRQETKEAQKAQWRSLFLNNVNTQKRGHTERRPGCITCICKIVKKTELKVDKVNWVKEENKERKWGRKGERERKNNAHRQSTCVCAPSLLCKAGHLTGRDRNCLVNPQHGVLSEFQAS